MVGVAIAMLAFAGEQAINSQGYRNRSEIYFGHTFGICRKYVLLVLLDGGQVANDPTLLGGSVAKDIVGNVPAHRKCKKLAGSGSGYKNIGCRCEPSIVARKVTVHQAKRVWKDDFKIHSAVGKCPAPIDFGFYRQNGINCLALDRMYRAKPDGYAIEIKPCTRLLLVREGVIIWVIGSKLQERGGLLCRRVGVREGRT